MTWQEIRNREMADAALSEDILELIRLGLLYIGTLRVLQMAAHRALLAIAIQEAHEDGYNLGWTCPPEFRLMP